MVVDELCFSEALLSGAKEVFGTMIFMDLQESTEPDENIKGPAVLGSITFTGVIEGCLAICCSIYQAKRRNTKWLKKRP
jgi:hypothetical protein